MKIKIERIYTKPIDTSGMRILVDRLWPRGISKINAKLSSWQKEIAPTNELRKWFAHDPQKFSDFQKRYIKELDDNPATVAFLNLVKSTLEEENIIFLFGAKEAQYNNATVLAKYVGEKLNLDK